MPTPTGHCCFLNWTGPGDSYLVTSRPWWAVSEWLKGVDACRPPDRARCEGVVGRRSAKIGRSTLVRRSSIRCIQGWIEYAPARLQTIS